MAEQRQDKTNGIGKVAAAGKKRRKGQDLQPIQTVPPQQNGFREKYGDSSVLTAAQNRDYLNRYATSRCLLRYLARLKVLVPSI
jgi:hypothetical protein